MGMGVPLLMGVAGEAARIVEAEKAGVCFTPEDAEMLVEKLDILKNDPGLRRQLAANAIAAAPKYSRTELAARMLTLLEKTVEPSPLSAQSRFR
jgi:glycosyltransferase involved in cell wall biosynthesis